MRPIISAAITLACLAFIAYTAYSIGYSNGFSSGLKLAMRTASESEVTRSALPRGHILAVDTASYSW